MRMELLGTVAVIGPSSARVEVRAPRPALLLGALALAHPRALDRNELVELLWPDDRPVDAARAVRQVVSRARAAIVDAGGAADMVRSVDGSVALIVGDLVVDVRRAIADVASAARLVEAGDADAAARTAAHALEQLARGLALHDDSVLVVAWRERLTVATARGRLVTGLAALRGGRFADAIDEAERILIADPFDEDGVRLLMRSHAAAGRRVAALAAYERHRRLLDDELGVRPSPQTEQLHVDLLGAAPDARRPETRTGPLGRRVPSDALPFVGRTREQAALRAAFDRVITMAEQQIVLVAGDAGIGKTRLVSELVAILAAPVAWGRCHASGAIAFSPFGDIVAQLVAARPQVVTGLGRQLDDLALLVPELGAGSADIGAQARDRMFRAVVAAVRAAAAEPVAVVLDDVQWASTDTLALLNQLIDATGDRPLLWIVIARDADGEAVRALAELRRAPHTRSLVVPALDAGEVAELLERSAVTVQDTTTQVAQRLFDRTAGNALFVTEFVRDAQIASGPVDTEALPPALAAILAARCATLDRHGRALVELAAVAGSDLRLELLEACTAHPVDVVLDLVDDLRARRLLDEHGIDAFTFTHDLVRDAVLAGVGPTRRARLHERVADALVALGGAAERVAHHLVEAGPRAADRAAEWCVRAGEEAARHGAWGAAAERLEWAIARTGEERTAIAARIELGRVQRALGEMAAARTTLHAAMTAARASRSSAHAAAATLALVGGGGRGVALDLADAQRAGELEIALADLDRDGDAPPALVVSVLGELALALALTDQEARRVELCERALALARASRDPAALAGALQTHRVALMGPRGTQARVADGRELLALPPAAVPHERRLFAALGLAEDLFELGDRAGGRAALAAGARVVAELPHPYWAWATDAWRVVDAVIDSDAESAEALAFATFAHLQATDHPEAVAALGVQLTNIRLLQGRAGEMLTVLGDAASANPNIPCYRAVFALCAAEAGDLDAARSAIEELFAHGDDFGLPADSNWLLAVAVLADAAATVGATEPAGALRHLLEPFADRHVVLNCYGGGGAYWGPVALVIARVAALAGDTDGAASAFGGAIRAAHDFGAPWFAARAAQRRDAVVGPASAARSRSPSSSQSSGSRASS